MILLLAGSLLNLLVIWWARRLPVVLLWLGYHAVLFSAFIKPSLLTMGIATWLGYLLPGPTLACILALLAIEAGALAVVRAGDRTDDEVVAAMKTAIACFCSFVLVCILAIALMVLLGIGMY